MSTRKLIVSHAGSQGVFGLIEQDLLKQLRTHQTEWVYGHKSHRVNIDIVSHPFEVAITKVNDELNKQPVMHIFWTDAENESYRNHVKDQLTTWLEKLQKQNCNNYLIVHATFQDKHAILHKFSVTKTSMAERVRNDFGSAKADRTVAFKAESNSVSSSQSWLITVGKVRDAILKSVTLKLAAYEKSVNQIRDTHEDENFDLYKYISAKEELCSLYEIIGLYEEAYRSSEEVLSLFRQYVANLRQCHIVPWIMEYIECEIKNWSGLNLSDYDNEAHSIKNFDAKQLNSLQLSSLIFRRIAQQLTVLQKPRDLAQKGLQFLLSVVRESKLLKAKYPEGAMKVWVYIGCIELLEAVKKSSPTALNNMDVPEPLAVAKAQLYDLAREKLYQLGALAGHIGEEEEVQGEEHIQLLIKGSKRVENPVLSPQSHNISSDVAKILTDKSFFHKQYIDLCQLSIVSYKLGSWIHHAQQVLLKQALYLRNRGIQTECLNAETHLRDVCHAYYTQGWYKLAAYSRVHLCETQRYLGLLDRELSTCCHLSTEIDHISGEDRISYSARLVECISLLNSKSTYDQLLVPFSPLFLYEIHDEDNLGCVLVREDLVMVKNTISVKIRLVNNCTEAMEGAVISMKLDTGSDTLNRSKSQVGDVNDFSMVPIESSSEIMEDGLYGISLKAESELVKDENAEVTGVKHMLLASQSVTLEPGTNNVVVSAELSKSGTFGVSSIQIQVGAVIFRQKCPPIPRWMEQIEIEPEASSVTVSVVQPASGMWVAGQKQHCTLSIFTDKAFHSLSITLKAPNDGVRIFPVDDGTYSVEGEEDGIFSLTQTEDYWNLTLPALMPNKLVRLDVPLICESVELYSQHLLDVGWSGGALSLLLTFYLPFILNNRLQFHDETLYLISDICSNVPSNITVTSVELEDPGSLTAVLPFRPYSLIPQQKLGCIWKMDRKTGTFPTSGKVKVDYTLPNCTETYTYELLLTCAPQDPHFSISISSKTKHHRVGGISQFQVTIQTPPHDKKIWRLLYGVDANTYQWAVCGYQRRQVDIVDRVVFSVDLLALKDGNLEYPKIRLWEYKDPQLQTVGNSKDLLYITSEEGEETKTELTAVSSDPLGVDSLSPVVVRKRSTSTLPRAEKIDYSGGKERVKSVTTIVLNTLNAGSLREVDSQCVCAYDLLSLVKVEA